MPTGSVTPAGGGGPAAGSYLPVAKASGVTVDTTTYNDPVSGGKLTTLIFPADRAVLAVAQSGDSFPRIILTSDGTDGLYLGDGTANTYAHAGTLSVGNNGDGTFEALLDAALSGTTPDTNAGRISRAHGSLQVAGASIISSGTGAPTARGGNVGDLYVRQDGGVLTTIYRCTVAGTAGNATWAGIV